MINKIKEFFKMRKRIKMFKKIYPGCEIVVNKKSKKIFVVKVEDKNYKMSLKEILERHFKENDE